MIKDINDLILLQNVKEFIEERGADSFLQSLSYLYPSVAGRIARAILADHVGDYDKKKAALLKAHAR